MRQYSASTAPQLSVEEIENIGSGPCLMFADEKNDDTEEGGGEIRRCYSFSSGKRFTLRAPQLQGRRCWGTQYGWLITLGLDCQMHLFNPLTQQQLSLPSQHTFKILPDEYQLYVEPEVMCSVSRTFLCHPTHQIQAFLPSLCLSMEFFISPLHRPETKLGDLSSSNPHGPWAVVQSITTSYFTRTIFILSVTMANYAFVTLTPLSQMTNLLPIFPRRWRGQKFYLVNISGDLHLICRTYSHQDTKSFDVYRFDFNKTEWIGVQDFKTQSLFVGNNTTFAISADDYSEVKANCVYFTDDNFGYYSEGFCDMGVYDFEKRTFLEPFYKGEDSLSNFSRPFFFMPSPGNKNTN